MSDKTDFDQLLDMVKLDSNLVDTMTDEQVTELRKRMNPYGRTIEGSGDYTCLSITNLSEKYMQRFLMTSLIGFLYRQCDEYMLDVGEPPTRMDNYTEYLENHRKSNFDAVSSKLFLKDYENIDEKKLTNENKADILYHTKMIERADGFNRRLVVRQFIDELFQFNPDKHVRSAYSDNPLDTERSRPCDKPTPEIERSHVSGEFDRHIPPSDTFHRWSYYTDSNYEEIRTAVRNIYCEKPDLEYAINPYSSFKTQEEAADFVQKHKDEVITDVLTLSNGKWNLCGSFKNNRERVNFYNNKTEIIEEIFKQMETDKKLGADMMRKRVRRKKVRNVKECGEEHVEFKQYRKSMISGVERMGAEDISLEPPEKKVEKNSVHEECPYDAVQVDVFDFRNGGQTVKKSEFFTQAEAPVSDSKY